jgi:two-component system cell cycle sensor histidine kinase/response regulator CckA
VIDQLTQAQRLESMGSMAAAVAHDFNNMLTVIMGIADELPMGPARSEIRRVTGNAATLTNKLLTFGHGQRASTEIHDLSHFMKEHSMLLQHTLDSRYIVIESYVEDPLLVRIEEGQFEQILVNLVNNAREAMPEGGELEVSLQAVELGPGQSHDKAGDYAVLEVRDSGRGIDKETQAKVFDPFFSTKETQANSGLGLSSCYGIVSQYGGVIEIDSVMDSGTTVRVFLPIAETRDYEPTLELIDNEVSIMVVDDDPGIVRVVRNALQRQGYHVRGFTDVDAALEFFSPNKVSLVISDVVMPGISGADLVRSLREQAPNLPVLFISGFTNDELENWRPDKYTSYLAKPFRGEEIIARVGTLLGSATRLQMLN